MSREIVLDTETTGLNVFQGDRIVEIGCVELWNKVSTGKTYHVYLNPERDVDDAAAQIHGLTTEFLKDKPVFAEAVDAFLAFIGEAPLVIHNASFDMGFINGELARLGFPPLPKERAIDTLEIARKKYFGAPATLDALCKRFSIDASHRTLHGALLDAELLAEVYLELCGGRQQGLALGDKTSTGSSGTAEIHAEQQRNFREPRAFPIADEERAAHEAFIQKIKNPIWKKA